MSPVRCVSSENNGTICSRVSVLVADMTGAPLPTGSNRFRRGLRVRRATGPREYRRRSNRAGNQTVDHAAIRPGNNGAFQKHRRRGIFLRGERRQLVTSKPSLSEAPCFLWVVVEDEVAARPDGQNAGVARPGWAGSHWVRSGR